MSEDLTGSRLGHYKIDGVLGRGGMSVMYRATDVRLGRKVALKVMAENITGDAEFRERFVDEARNTSAIDHPNIVPLYDFGEIDGVLYLAMRLVDGSDLASLLADGPLPPPRALDLLGQVAEALDTLHEQGLVHLDLKPANVLVTGRESHEHVYLADFGLTRRGATGHRTASGDFLGSPTYAAPEHLRGDPLDGRTDLYSLACVAYTCLTGRAPFQGEVQQIIQGHLSAPPPAVSAAVPVSPAVDEAVRTGMAKNPRERFGTCRALIGALRRAFDTPQPAPGAPGQVPGAPPGPAPGPAPGHPAAPAAGPATPPGQPAPPPAGTGPAPGPGPRTPGPPPQPGSTSGGPAGGPPRMSAGSSRGGAARWVVPLLAGAAVLVIIALFVVMVVG
ncbi:hypothetical protein GCM10027174_05400 [Salinifilum aidingensis]